MKNYINSIPLFRNGRKSKEPYTGYLLRQSGSRTVSIEFKYGTIKGRDYAVSPSGLIGHEYILSSEIIRTSRLDIPFTKGDCIRLADGREMTTTAATFELDDNRAIMTNDGRTAWIITLEGGGE